MISRIVPQVQEKTIIIARNYVLGYSLNNAHTLSLLRTVHAKCYVRITITHC